MPAGLGHDLDLAIVLASLDEAGDITDTRKRQAARIAEVEFVRRLLDDVARIERVHYAAGRAKLSGFYGLALFANRYDTGIFPQIVRMDAAGGTLHG